MNWAWTEVFAARGEIEKLRQLTDFAIARHYPDADGPMGLLTLRPVPRTPVRNKEKVSPKSCKIKEKQAKQQGTAPKFGGAPKGHTLRARTMSAASA